MAHKSDPPLAMTPNRRALLLRRFAIRSAVFQAQARSSAQSPKSIARVRFVEPIALSPRQSEVVQLAADGSTNVEIASALAISLETVKAHMANVSERLGTRNRASAVAVALRRGFIH